MTDTALQAASEPTHPPIPWAGLFAVLLGTFLSTLNGLMSTFVVAYIV
jgi:hypothetical protein